MYTLSRKSQIGVNKHIQGDLTEFGKWAEQVENIQPSIVFHLAAVTRDNGSGDIQEKNNRSMRNLLEAIRSAKSQVILASSVAVYGKLANSKILDEETPNTACDGYGLSKIEQEQILWEYSDDIGKHCSSIRFSNLIGPRLSSEYFLVL